MKKVVFMYAGQGAQAAGMGAEFYNSYKSYKDTIDSLEDSDRIRELLLNAELSELSKTENTQPAMASHEAAITDLLAEHGIRAAACCGLSLGEYGAFYAAGVMDADTLEKVTRIRGRIMADASKDKACRMCAVIGLEASKVEELCAQCKESGMITVANYNCPGQYVICGDDAPAQKVSELAVKEGAKVIELNVSGPFHSEYMNEVAGRFKDELIRFDFNEPAVPVYLNYTGQPYDGWSEDKETASADSSNEKASNEKASNENASDKKGSYEKVSNTEASNDNSSDPDAKQIGTPGKDTAIKANMCRQITGSVQMETTIRNLLKKGYRTFIEIGPGKTLGGFVKKTAREVGVKADIYSTSSVKEVEKIFRDIRPTAVVTGGSRGIGRSICKELIKDGYNVVFSYMNGEEAAGETKLKCEELGGKALAVKADVKDENACIELIKTAYEFGGSIDVLVNNAGTVRDKLLIGMKAEDYDAVMNTCLKGSFFMLREAAKYMIKQRSGVVVNISSVVGLHGNAGQTNYSSAKAGLIGLTKSAAKELSGRGIRVNAIAPGMIDTDMTADLPDNVKEVMKQQIPLGHAGEAEDVANAVVFLCSSKSRYITGQVVSVDGGMSI